jgi:hypothetical protein
MRASKIPSILRPIAAGALCSVAACGGASERAYVERLGSDTMAVEVYTRSGSGFEGHLLTRSPVTRVANYVGTLSPEGTISRLEVNWTTPEENPEGPPPESWSVTVADDSATVVREADGESTTTRVAAPNGVIPQIGRTPWSYAILEQAVRQAMATGGDSVPITMLPGGRPRPVPNAIQRLDSQTVEWSAFGMPMTAQVDPEGKVLALSGSQTTIKVEGEAVPDVDFATLAADFAARDARGEGIGVPSPPAQVDVTAGGAHFQVEYSQPAMRGRQIWGGLVPYEEVWRTGANAATVFTTDRDLDMRGTRIPAGSYSLWTMFTPSEATLIVNSQTGQWGTAYDGSQDFARIMMDRTDLDAPVERFTIAVEEAEGGASLQLRWDRTQFSVPIVVR